MSEHTPEPWAAVRNTAYWEIGTEIDGYYANRIGDVCSTDPNNPDSGKQEANARRIVACVNSCAGMEDPAAEIARLRAEVKRWKAEALAARPFIDMGCIEAWQPDGFHPGIPTHIAYKAARVADLEADRNSWKAIAEKRHDILLGVEWSGEVEAEAQSEGCCPYCLAYSDRKHEVGCKMAEAIAESARAANEGRTG